VPGTAKSWISFRLSAHTCILSHVNAVLHWYGRMAAGQCGDEHGVRVVASVETATKALAWCSGLVVGGGGGGGAIE
jgi:hypothetical protein